MHQILILCKQGNDCSTAMPIDSNQGCGPRTQRACLQGSNQGCITDLWAAFKYFLIGHGAVPHCDVNMGPRSRSHCQITWLQHTVTGTYTHWFVWMVSRRSHWSPTMHNIAHKVTQIYLVTPILRVCIQPNHLGFSTFFFIFSYAWINKTTFFLSCYCGNPPGGRWVHCFYLHYTAYM